MPTFQDSENRKPLVDEGDYVLQVSDFEIGISTGLKTSGSEKYVVTFAVEGHGTLITETLTDHPSIAWKIDCFLKSGGIRLKKGQSFSFRKDEAEQQGIPWVDPIGLRCHAKVIQDEYTPKATPGQPPPEKRKSNKIAVFYTDRPALPRAEQPEQATPEEDENTPF